MTPVCEYLNYSGRDDLLAGGVHMVPVQTRVGAFKVWTKRMATTRRSTAALAQRTSTSKPSIAICRRPVFRL